MSRFKVGDKVKVVKTYESDNRRSFIGRVLTIAEINGMGRDWYLRKGFDYFSVAEKDVNYIFYEDELELVERKSFTKSDLRDGMVVEYRSGNRRIVLDGLLTSYHHWGRVDTYRDDLTNKNNIRDTDIVKVYISSSHILEYWCRDEYLDLIWEREPDYKEMTVAEIEEKLGYKVKVISDD